MKTEFALLINTCDKFEDCWDPELKLVICNIDYQQSADTPQNILIDRTIDRSKVGKLRPYYYHSLAVGIPLKEEISWCNGSIPSGVFAAGNSCKVIKKIDFKK
jgi:hypothetical protein